MCDTFSGLPFISKFDKEFYEHEYAFSLESVKEYLQSYSFNIIKGIFPNKESVNKLSNHQFSFIHLDVDVYQSTKDCLEFFYPLMIKNGIILTHDYSNTEGVKKAFDDFFDNKVESVLELSTSQAIIVKS